MLKFLRERGCSKIESMKILMDLKKISLAEAKRLVHLSATWKRERKRDEAFHEAVDDTLQGVE